MPDRDRDEREVSRRQLLATGGLVMGGSLAGCFKTPSGNGAPTKTTETPTTTETPETTETTETPEPTETQEPSRAQAPQRPDSS